MFVCGLNLCSFIEKGSKIIIIKNSSKKKRKGHRGKQKQIYCQSSPLSLAYFLIWDNIQYAQYHPSGIQILCLNKQSRVTTQPLQIVWYEAWIISEVCGWVLLLFFLPVRAKILQIVFPFALLINIHHS